MKNTKNTALLTEEELDALLEDDYFLEALEEMAALSPVLPREHLHYIILVEGCQGVFVKKFFIFLEKRY